MAPDASAAMIAFARKMREDFTRFMMEYQFAADEVMTKVTILREEFLHLHRYNPIEHVKSRVKSPESILDKVVKRGLDPSFDTIRANITDIAGIRITCSFIADTYRILEALTSQDDVRIVKVKDYIASPKPNGYKSLHAIIEVPVFLSTGAVPVAPPSAPVTVSTRRSRAASSKTSRTRIPAWPKSSSSARSV